MIQTWKIKKSNKYIQSISNKINSSINNKIDSIPNNVEIFDNYIMKKIILDEIFFIVQYAISIEKTKMNIKNLDISKSNILIITLMNI